MRFRHTNKKKRFGWRSRALALLFVVALVGGILATNLYKPTKASAAINYVNQSTNSSSTVSGTLSINTPSGIATGNVLIAQIIALPGTSNAVNITPPTGWTLIGTSPSSNKYTMSLYSHVVAGGDPTSVSWSFSPTSTATGGITAFSGVDTQNPVDATNSQTNGSTTSHTAPSVTASYSNGMVVPFWGFQTGQNATSMDAQLTSIWGVNNGSNSGISAGYYQLTNAGATGTFSATTASTSASLAQTIALQPAVGAAGVQFVAVSTPVKCTTACNSITTTMPTGWKNGDLFITSVTWNTNTSTLTAPSGYVQIGSTITTGSFAQADFYRYATTGDPNSFTFNFSANTALAMINTIEFQGVDQTSPIDNETSGLSPNGTTDTTPSINTNVAQDMLFDIISWNTGTTGALPGGSSMTEIWDDQTGNASTNVSSWAGYELLGVATPSGSPVNTRTITSGRTAIAMMHSIAIKPALPAPQLTLPANGAKAGLLPTFRMVSATLAGNLQYKIQLCSAANCTGGSVLTTFDQTVSQTGWSGQDYTYTTPAAGLAYVATTDGSGSTVAQYTAQTALTECTTYHWRAAGYDPSITQLYNYSPTRSFSTSCRPSAPTLIFPNSGATGVRYLPEFQLASTDLDGDYVQYKIELCSTSNCSSIISTYDQTTSQAGWTGQDAQNFTAYTADSSSYVNSVKGYYKQSSALTGGTTYYWRAYAIDPAGTNTWSPVSSIQSFTVNTAETRILEGSIQSGRIL